MLVTKLVNLGHGFPKTLIKLFSCNYTTHLEETFVTHQQPVKRLISELEESTLQFQEFLLTILFTLNMCGWHWMSFM